jgi:hypothetical protein
VRRLQLGLCPGLQDEPGFVSVILMMGPLDQVI